MACSSSSHNDGPINTTTNSTRDARTRCLPKSNDRRKCHKKCEKGTRRARPPNPHRQGDSGYTVSSPRISGDAAYSATKGEPSDGGRFSEASGGEVGAPTATVLACRPSCAIAPARCDRARWSFSRHLSSGGHEEPPVPSHCDASSALPPLRERRRATSASLWRASCTRCASIWPSRCCTSRHTEPDVGVVVQLPAAGVVSGLAVGLTTTGVSATCGKAEGEVRLGVAVHRRVGAQPGVVGVMPDVVLPSGAASSAGWTSAGRGMSAKGGRGVGWMSRGAAES
eukprot:scaffold30350_cov105-Isochrysis_galbana.AAC.3